jgi:hypothetical protein
VRLEEVGQLSKVFGAFGRGRGGSLGPNEGRAQRELGQLVPEGIQRLKVVLQDIGLRSAQKMKELNAPGIVVPLCQNPIPVNSWKDLGHSFHCGPGRGVFCFRLAPNCDLMQKRRTWVCHKRRQIHSLTLANAQPIPHDPRLGWNERHGSFGDIP